jgi:hypothetical protein
MRSSAGRRCRIPGRSLPRRIAPIFLLASLLSGAVTPMARSADPTPPPTVPTPAPPTPTPSQILRGEVVETGCFIIGNRRGPAHAACATACARAGQDLGVLDEESGLLYVAVVDRRDGPTPNPLLSFIAHRVEVQGRALERGGLPAVVISDVRSLAAPAP